MKFIKRRWHTLALVALTLSVGFGLGVLVLRLDLLPFGPSCQSSSFQYLGQDLGCTPSPVVNKSGYITLKNDLLDFIQQQKNSGSASTISIYFRDLDDGPTLGINEHELFAPASLLKVPMLLAYLNLEENDSTVAQTRLGFDGYMDNLEQDIQPKDPIMPNTPYTIDDLIAHMIKYSDNQAYYVLREHLRQISPNEDILKNTFVDLGILDPKSLIDETITVKSYASIFIQLYYSSFFNTNKFSNKALAILAHTDFTQGLNAGVPANIPIAHKFGERTGFPGGVKQLHDCGIVYYPKNPYLICIMTRGTDFSKLEGVIAAISKMTYEEFDSRRL